MPCSWCRHPTDWGAQRPESESGQDYQWGCCEVWVWSEPADVQAEIARAGAAGGPVEEIDIEAAYDEFDRLDLGEQRETIRGAFASIKMVPRGKGRPKTGEPMWLPKHIATRFTPEWS